MKEMERLLAKYPNGFEENTPAPAEENAAAFDHNADVATTAAVTLSESPKEPALTTNLAAAATEATKPPTEVIESSLEQDTEKNSLGCTELLAVVSLEDEAADGPDMQVTATSTVPATT